MKRTLVLVFLMACAAEQPSVEISTDEQAATVCGSGPTVKGIDVSYYQGAIDWAKVKADGVQFAFIRATDGSYQDPKFASYWADSRAHGILHGAYQFFRPGQDVIAQADLLLSKIGTPMPDDLPPVLDVEAADGKTPAQVAAGVRQWVAHVKAAIHKDPIIYTGFYFWRDSVGAPDVTTSPLWHAQYSSAACPNIAPPWTDWAFWQYTSSGAVAGIAGNVDTDRFNGTHAQLVALTFGGGTPAAPCAEIAREGGTIDDGDACFEAGGPSVSMRHVSDAGEGGDLVWTHTTEDPTEGNFGQWNLKLAEAGTYKIEVYTAGKYAQSKQASYVVHTASGDHTQRIDQSAVDGWQTLGELDLAAGDGQFIHLGDNTGELLANNVQIVFDAVRLTRVAGGMPGDGSGSGSGSGNGDGMTDPGGCSASGGSAGSVWMIALVAVGVARRRRRR